MIGLSVTVLPSGGRARELVEGYAVVCRDGPWVVGGQGAPSLSEIVSRWNGHIAPSDDAEVAQLFARFLTRAT